MTSPYVFSSTDPLGYTVVLTERTKNIHITPGHESEGITVDDVEYTVTDPDTIHKSNQNDSRVYDRKSDKVFLGGEEHVRVVATPIGNNFMRIISAYPRKNLSTGIDEKEKYYERA